RESEGSRYLPRSNRSIWPSLAMRCTSLSAASRLLISAAALISLTVKPLGAALSASNTLVRSLERWTSAASPRIVHRQLFRSNVTACSASSTSRPRTYRVVPCELHHDRIGTTRKPKRAAHGIDRILRFHFPRVVKDGRGNPVLVDHVMQGRKRVVVFGVAVRG